MKYYGSDKPDLRFGMKFVELMDIMKGHGFPVFDNAAYIGGICAEGAAHYTRKQLDVLTEFVKRPQIGAKGMVYARVEADGNVKSSVDKFYAQEVLQEMIHCELVAFFVSLSIPPQKRFDGQNGGNLK